MYNNCNDTEQCIAAMADLMVKARRAHEDVGELVAAALHTAATQLGDALSLVWGRPGSWEAEIVLNMTRTGGVGNPERIASLTTLFVAMGRAGADGGDVLSQAMGCAVDTLGGFVPFLGSSGWYWQLANLGCQYAREWDDSPYHKGR